MRFFTTFQTVRDDNKRLKGTKGSNDSCRGSRRINVFKHEHAKVNLVKLFQMFTRKKSYQKLSTDKIWT